MNRTKLHTPPRPRLQHAWELELRPTDFRIPAAPAGIQARAVLANPVWAAAPDEAEMASFVVVLS